MLDYLENKLQTKVIILNWATAEWNKTVEQLKNEEKIKEKAIVELIQNPTEEIKKSVIEQIPVEQKENIIEEEIEIIKNELKKVYNAVITPELTGFDQATEDKIGKYQINDFILYHLFMRGASKERIIYLLESCFDLELDDCLKYYDNFIKRFNSNQY